MLRNYIKVAFRYLLRNKQYAVINVSGLAIAIAAGILIIQFVKNELGYDRFHSKSGRIVRLWQEEMYNGEKFICTTTPYSAASEIKAAYSEVENYCRVHSFESILKYGAKSFPESARMVDSTFFNVFDFEILSGDRSNPFPSKSSVLLTPEIAQKLFGTEEPLGKTIQLSLNNKEVPFIVSGIVKAAPANSSIQYKALIPYSNSKDLISERVYNSWTNVSAESYLLLKTEGIASRLEKNLPSLVKQHFADRYKPGAFTFHLQPLKDIHLNSALPPGNEPVSDAKYSYILGTIGLLLILVASVNFIILSLGRAVSRYREVGVRKVLGALPSQLIKQYWGESLFITCCSAMLGFLLAWFSFGAFKYMVAMDFDFVIDLQFIGYTLLLVLVISLLAGIYPALILSKYRPAETIRNLIFGAGKNTLMQDVLVTGQLIVSIALIVCTFMVRRQMDYISTTDLGYKRNRLVVIETHKRSEEGFKLCERLKTELGNSFDKKDYTCSFYSFVQNPWFALGFTDKDKIYKGFNYNSVDAGFIPSMGLTMAAGRNFREGDMNDERNSAVVNEAFVKYFNLSDPVGKKIPGPFHPTIIGVVKDFNYMPLHNAVEPLMMTIAYDSVLATTENISYHSPPDPRITVRLREGSLSNGISQLERIWKKVVPSQQFDYTFVDDGLAAQYQNEKRMGAVAGAMAGLSIFISCLGLFGLATLNVSRRTKEIGIRKVLGASNAVIIWLLSSRIVRLVLIAAVIAVPFSWYALSRWLSDFAYHASLDWKQFVFASLITLVIALITISFQTLRAARENPVNSLKTE